MRWTWNTGAVIAAEMHPANRGDTAILPGTLASAATHLAAVNAAPTSEDPAELVADKGYYCQWRHPEVTVIVPPRATAVLSDTAESEPTQRDCHLQCIAKHGRLA